MSESTHKFFASMLGETDNEEEEEEKELLSNPLWVDDSVEDGLRFAQGEHGGRGNIGVRGNRKSCSFAYERFSTLAMMYENEGDVEKYCTLR